MRKGVIPCVVGRNYIPMSYKAMFVLYITGVNIMFSISSGAGKLRRHKGPLIFYAEPLKKKKKKNYAEGV